MTDDDMDLVRDYATHHSENAFAALVSRHTALVYSAALRQTHDPHLAEEVAQAVFIILARKAGSLNPNTILSGWLYLTSCHVSASALKRERRRQHREQEAYMQSTLSETDATWKQLSPLLEEAMLRLGATDRDALVLRYFQNRTLPEVGAALGLEERAAQKRVARAVEKLRKIFVRQGVTISATAIASMVSANSVQAAPVGLVKIISTVAVAKSEATTTSTLVKGALKIMAWTKAKTAIMAGAGVLFVAVTVPLVISQYKSGSEPASWRQRFETAYKLNDGELLKHISEPFIPERAEYYHRDKSQRVQAKYEPDPPKSFVFKQDGQQLQAWESNFGPAFMRLLDVSRDLFQIVRQDVEGPEELLDLKLNGDWTFRAGTDREKLLQSLEAIVRQETGRNIRIEPHGVERLVMVAKGSLMPALRLEKLKGVSPRIDIYAEKKDDPGVTGGGSTPDLLYALRESLNLRVVNELPVEFQTFRFDWRIHGDSMEWHMGNRREELRAKVLDNIAQQTGISFTQEKRMVEVWFISEQK